MKFTIEGLSKGEYPVKNDGTLEELRKVLKAAFPNTPQTAFGTSRYYHRNENLKDQWLCSDPLEEDFLVASVKTFLKQIEMSNTSKTVTLSLEVAKKMFTSNEPSLKAFALENYSEKELTKKELPKSWEELGNISGYYTQGTLVRNVINTTTVHEGNKSIFPTRELAEATIALAQLLQLREVYRNGWVPDYTKDELKFSILVQKDKFITGIFTENTRIFSFQSIGLRDEFLKNFRDLLEIAKPLL